MKKRIYSVLVMLLIATLLTSTASAGGAIKFSSVTFDLGSLISKGYVNGLGNQDVTVVLNASGIPVITCTNNGNNDVRGQSSPKISAVGEQRLSGSEGLTKNGKTAFFTETDDPETIAWDVGGCPNSKWTAFIEFIFWTDATLSVYDMHTGELLASQSFTCTTTRFPESVSCTPVE